MVRAPIRASDKAIGDFVELHKSWIEKKLAQVGSRVVEPPKRFVHGEKFMFLGKSYPLEIVTGQKKLLVLGGSFYLSASVLDKAELIFERWYRRQAKKIIQERVENFAGEYGFQYLGIKITSAKTRWGSCSSTGSLNFSWRLILAPLEQVDYVVVHELVHTIQHNHSKRFWRKVEMIMPDYKERKKWLTKNGRGLMA